MSNNDAINKSSGGATELIYFETHVSPQCSDWVVMIHGAGGSTRTWKRQTEDFMDHYNLLIIDLPGHGQNAIETTTFSNYSFQFVAEKIWEVIDHLDIAKIHLLGVSLGSIISLQMRIINPERVLSVIMPGAIVKLNTKLRVLANMSLGLAKVIGFRNFYNLSARIMLPRRNHKKSRDVFIKESKALSIGEFEKWTALYYNLNNTLIDFFKASSSIPHLLIMGSQDHLFLNPAKEYAMAHDNSILHVVPDCGHVVSIERAKEFNRICLAFLKSL